MCGLFGWDLRSRTLSLSKSQRGALSLSLAQSNDTRGGDAWGIWHPWQPSLTRGLGDLAPHWRGIAAAPRSTHRPWVLCHTRHATHGSATSVACAHPFKIGSVVGMHNGVLTNHEELNWLFKRNFKVDSQHLVAHLAEGQTAEEWKNIDGYGTVVWTDDRIPGQTFFLRFNGGELVLALLEDGGFVWSSTLRHLNMALSAAGLKSKTRFALKEGFVHTIRNDAFLIYETWRLQPSPSATWGVEGGTNRKGQRRKWDRGNDRSIFQTWDRRRWDEDSIFEQDDDLDFDAEDFQQQEPLATLDQMKEYTDRAFGPL